MGPDLTILNKARFRHRGVVPPIRAARREGLPVGDASGLRVLLVEDSAFDARLILEQLGAGAPDAYSARHVNCLADAREVLSAGTTDCVLLDLALPDASGLHGLTTLLASHPEVPVIVLSATDEAVLGAQAVQAGAQDYLTKGTIDGPQLWRSIRYARERKRAQLLLHHQAMHDSLTGLPNRMLFLDRVTQALARLARRPGQVAVLFLDLDGFKQVNDSLGHAAGDTVMVEVAHRLQSALRPYDTAARMGGDEFVVLADAPEDDEAATLHLAERIRQQLGHPIRVQDTDVQISASIGITCTDDSTADAAALIRNADAAMYRAKALGKNRSALFDPDLRGEAKHSLRLKNQAVVPDLPSFLTNLAQRQHPDAEALPRQHDLDREVLDRLADRIGRGAVVQLVAMFRDDVARSGPRLSAAAAAGDHVEVAALAHRMRTASRTLGAAHLAEALGALEDDAATQPYLANLVDVIVEEMQRVITELSTAAEGADAHT
jgi:diguanylate cyclase (GGDEF)-like protein